MKVIFAGTPQVAIPTAESLLAHGHEVVGVLTRPDAPVGRKRIMTPSPVAAWAQSHGLSVIKTTTVDSDIDATIAALGAEVGVVVAYGALLPPSTLKLFEHGWLNLHFSALPLFRGAAPVQRALMAGESTVGTCVFRLVQKMDAGAVASRRSFNLTSNETAHSLLERLSIECADQVSQVLADITTGNLKLEEQVGTPTFAPKIEIDEARFVASDSATANFNRFRGVTTEPGFWFLDGFQRVKVHSAAISPTPVTPGVLELHADAVHLGCSAGSLILNDVQPAGKSSMRAIDWMRGRHS